MHCSLVTETARDSGIKEGAISYRNGFLQDPEVAIVYSVAVDGQVQRPSASLGGKAAFGQDTPPAVLSRHMANVEPSISNL